MTEHPKTIITNILRRIWFGKTQYLAGMTFAVTLTCVTIFVIPVRNVIFHQTIEYAWRDVGTSDLIRIHYGNEIIPLGILAVVSCPVFEKPKLNKSDIETSNILTYNRLQIPEIKKRVLKKGHGRFLPVLSPNRKIDILYLYKLASAALDSVGVNYFLVAGSLLGLNRHRGFVPWDDDLDIAVSLASWDLVKQTLSCIEGFALRKEHPAHWKLQFSGSIFPFLDIFFYKMDESYVWAAAHYVRKTFIYPKSLVFPLGESIFEGMVVSVPNDSLSIVRRIYQYDVCETYRGHIERNMSSSDDYPEGYSVTNVPCSDLSYMYSFF